MGQDTPLYDWAFGDPSLRAHTPGFYSNDPYSANDPDELYSNAYFAWVEANGGVDPYAGTNMIDWAFADPSPTPHTPGVYSNDPYSTNDPLEPYTNAWYQVEQQNAWDMAVNQNTEQFLANDPNPAPPGYKHVVDIWGEPVYDAWGNPVYTDIDPYTQDYGLYSNDLSARGAARYSNDWQYDRWSNDDYYRQSHYN